MDQSNFARPQRNGVGSLRRWWVGPAAFLAAMLAAPAGASFDIPDDPLTTAARVAPNILFILDDSGSMAFEYMPDSPLPTSDPDVSGKAYTRNSLSYNPAVTYQPWLQADGTRMTLGVSYSSVYGSFNRAAGSTINLGNSRDCRTYNRNTQYWQNGRWNEVTVDEGGLAATYGTQVCGGVQTYYVPKDPSNSSNTYLNNGRNYYRYEILEGGSGILRSSYGSKQASPVRVGGSNPYTGSLNNNNVVSHDTESVGAGRRLTITVQNTTSQNNRRLDYEVRGPSGSVVCSGRVDGNSNRADCVVYDTASGIYQVGVQRVTNNSTSYRISATSSNSCDGGSSGSGWIDCAYVLPNASRTLAQELQNYATWFSYHRTRMKAAKAGASEAFSALDSQVRVGFRTIWDRSGTKLDIPVGDGNEGRFEDRTGEVVTTSRSAWYSRLHNVVGVMGTPLHDALDGAGQYFSSSGSTGPYGPQSGSSQYSCRQNFAILTTDGYWNNVGVNVGNQDNQAGNPITGPNDQSFTYTPAAPYSDRYSNTLADVAMKYWKSDLRSDMTNNVPVTGANPAFWQHMVTFGISIGLKGNKPWSSVSDVPTNATWDDPTDSEDADRIDDLLHAAVNSRGAFVAASNPHEFTEGLTAALSAISQRTSSYSNVATNSVSVEGGTRVFNASYVSGIWSGTVTARPIRSGAVGWTASVPAFAQRQDRVFTFDGSMGTLFPTSAQMAALARAGGPANYAVSGENNANYLMGDATLEERNGVGKLRNRLSRLGDIVHSSPAFVRETGTLYVGANDGMLHAFDAADGRELFAYVPNIINFANLADLSRPDYAHKYFVDGPVAVSSRSQTPGENVLVGSLGRGGRGLYALDVTSPESFGTGNVMWERAETPDGNMGLVLGRPLIANVATGETAVIVANGINSANNQAALLVLDLDDGSVIKEISTGVGSEDAPNGLSTPTAVYGPDGKTIAYVYAGDMLGNVWRFDLSETMSSSWSVTRLFTAQDAEGRAQPITGGVALATHPRTFERWIFFGTGRYLTVEDANPDNSTPQSMYAFAEPGASEAALGRDELEERQIVQITEQLRGFQEREPLPPSKAGWFIDLPGNGERIVQDAQVASGYLVTASMMPTGDACEADGTGFINALDAFTGTSGGTSYFDLDGDGSTADEVIGGVPVGSYNPGVGMPTLPNLLRGRLVVGGTAGSEDEIGTLQPRWDRVSWREIRGE